jgi:hypothetical protein
LFTIVHSTASRWMGRVFRRDLRHLRFRWHGPERRCSRQTHQGCCHHQHV